jgi:hypothetical protein
MNYRYNGDKGRTLKKLIIDNCIMTIVMGNVAYGSSSSQIPGNIAAACVGELSAAMRNQSRIREWSIEKHSSQQRH